MKNEERNKLVELFNVYCDDSVKYGWCDKHDCDFCHINSTAEEMIDNIDSAVEDE